MDNVSMMDMDRTACYRAISTRDARFDGRLFVGVRTTGIYCRPICPARTPKFENVSFYASAAAAQEAGFRPCLRCRPEISPELAFWRGTSNTVSRALALIEAGGLDDDDVEGLSDRLGGGARQMWGGVPHRGGGGADRGRPDAAGAARQAVDPRDVAADGASRAGVGLQQRAPLQRDIFAVVRTCAGDAAADSRPREARTRGGR